MDRNAFAGMLMVVGALLLIIMGVQGSLGKVVAVVFVPGELLVQSQTDSLWKTK